MELTVKKLAEHIGAELAGAGDVVITGVGPVDLAGGNEVTFISNKKHLSKLAGCRGGAVIISERMDGLELPQLIVANVDAALIKTLEIFAPSLEAFPAGVDSTAKVSERAKISATASIGPNAAIGAGAEIGEDTIISSGCHIGAGSKIGSHCRLGPNVVVLHNCRIGNNCIIQANTTIGSTGFGYSLIDGEHKLIPHNGGVIIEDFVEIGANCCVDRAKFDNTVIGAGTKIDNLVQIAHNVIIGRCCLIASLTGISGSCKLGDSVVLGGQVGVADNKRIGDGVMVAGGSAVMQDIADGQVMMGTPAVEAAQARRMFTLRKRLPKMAEQLRQLIKRVERLEAPKDDKE